MDLHVLLDPIVHDTLDLHLPHSSMHGPPSTLCKDPVPWLYLWISTTPGHQNTADLNPAAPSTCYIISRVWAFKVMQDSHLLLIQMVHLLPILGLWFQTPYYRYSFGTSVLKWAVYDTADGRNPAPPHVHIDAILPEIQYFWSMSSTYTYIQGHAGFLPSTAWTLRDMYHQPVGIAASSSASHSEALTEAGVLIPPQAHPADFRAALGDHNKEPLQPSA